MKYLKLILLLFILLPGMANAQEMVIEDITFLVRYVTGDNERHHVAVTKSFAESDHGSELMERVRDYENRAVDYNVHQDAVKGQEKMKEYDPYAELDRIYDEWLGLDKDLLDKGHITKEEFEKRKARNMENRAEAKKSMRREVESIKEMSNAMVKYTSGEMPDDAEELLKDLYKYAVGGKSFRHITDLGKGLVNVSDGIGDGPSWGIINLFDTQLFEQKYYSVRSRYPERDIFVLRNAQNQYGLFHYNGTPVMPMQKNEIWIDPEMATLLMFSNRGITVLDFEGNPRFTYVKLNCICGKYWAALNSNGSWGLVDKDNKVLLPFKYVNVNWTSGNHGKVMITAYTTAGENDRADLFDPDTMEHIGKIINGRTVMDN